VGRVDRDAGDRCVMVKLARKRRDLQGVFERFVPSGAENGWMDRGDLETLLGQGLSLAEIGRQVGLHEATVGYWVKKHGLQAVNRRLHASRGGIPEGRLRQLVDAGLSVAQIAREIDRSKGTVRHWLTRYGLKTHGALGRAVSAERAAAKAAGLQTIRMQCRHHGMTAFILDRRGSYRCKACRAAAVARRRRKMKEILVAEAGGECSVCHYSRDMRALHFHHVEPELKRHEINARGAGLAIATLRAEAEKCVLVCANCHAELESGIITLAEPDRARTMLQPGRRPG
jgi:transposase-like protein